MLQREDAGGRGADIGGGRRGNFAKGDDAVRVIFLGTQMVDYVV